MNTSALANIPRKYPRTFHHPLSEGVSNDDKQLASDGHLLGKRVIITEKMDGENTTLYPHYIHARSLDSAHHPSRDWVKQFHASIKHNIPPGMRVCGENLYAKHSIGYHSLDSFFLAFSVWDGDTCLSWDDTILYLGLLDIRSVPVLYDGVYARDIFEKLVSRLDTQKQEGLVARVSDSFDMKDFKWNVCKWVRKGHVQTDKHWTKQQMIMNGVR